MSAAESESLATSRAAGDFLARANQQALRESETQTELRPLTTQYLVFYSEETKAWADAFARLSGDSHKFVLAQQLKYGEFPDGTLKGEILDLPLVRDRNVLYLSSYSTYQRLYEDYAGLTVIAGALPRTLTVVLPFMPSGTMERVPPERPGMIATAAVDARLISSVPATGSLTRYLLCDVHSLGTIHLFHGTSAAANVSCIPAAIQYLSEFQGLAMSEVAVCFPDDGAAKRFGGYFKNSKSVVCAKVRSGRNRSVHIKDGADDVVDTDVLIIDDLVQTGGTLLAAAAALKSAGARRVSVFVTHAVFPEDAHLKFLDTDIDMVYTTDSRPTVVQKLRQFPKKFVILPIAPILAAML